MKFRLRTLIALVTLCSVVALLISISRDYIYIRVPTFSAPTITDDVIRNRIKMIEQRHPPKTKEYWQEQLDKVKPKMTTNALFKYGPSIGNSYSMMRSDNSQAFYYAVDSKYGVACKMSLTSERVVGPLGVFEHGMNLDEFGGIEIEKIAGLRDFLDK